MGNVTTMEVCSSDSPCRSDEQHDGLMVEVKMDACLDDFETRKSQVLLVDDTQIHIPDDVLVKEGRSKSSGRCAVTEYRQEQRAARSSDETRAYSTGVSDEEQRDDRSRSDGSFGEAAGAQKERKGSSDSAGSKQKVKGVDEEPQKKVGGLADRARQRRPSKLSDVSGASKARQTSKVSDCSTSASTTTGPTMATWLEQRQAQLEEQKLEEERKKIVEERQKARITQSNRMKLLGKQTHVLSVAEL